MTPLVVLLLLTGFCAESALSLYCYRCNRVTSHEDCKDVVKCSDLERYCVLHEQPGPGVKPIISKWCSPECPQFGPGTPGGRANVSMHCCQSDYCNGSGPSGGGSSGAVVIAATLASFLYILPKGP